MSSSKPPSEENKPSIYHVYPGDSLGLINCLVVAISEEDAINNYLKDLPSDEMSARVLKEWSSGGDITVENLGVMIQVEAELRIRTVRKV